MDCENILNTQYTQTHTHTHTTHTHTHTHTKRMSCTISIHYLRFANFPILTYCHISLNRGQQLAGSFLKNF